MQTPKSTSSRTARKEWVQGPMLTAPAEQMAEKASSTGTPLDSSVFDLGTIHWAGDTKYLTIGLGGVWKIRGVVACDHASSNTGHISF